MAPASQEPKSTSSTTTRSDGDSPVDNIAQAYKDLLRGEQAATALEANLTNLESRLDALLAAFEVAEGSPKDGTAVPQDDNLKNQDGAAHNGAADGQNENEGSDPAKASKKT
ncbi:hypothetical protein EsH8_I_000949 [Colletotrichum jinshuiense]